MTLLSFGPTATPAPTAPEPLVTPHASNTLIANNTKPVSSLRGYIEGMRVNVNWYSQLANQNQATYGHDVGKSPLLQQYSLIKGLEIILDGDLTPTQNTQDKTFTITGTGFVTSGIVPNEGNLFLMDVGDARTGIMQVNNTTRMTSMNESVYQIDFQQVFYASDTTRLNDLNAKVVQEFVFVRDFAQFGRDPVITTTQYTMLKDLSKIGYDLVEDYLRSFTNNEHRLLTIPGQSLITTDAYTVKAFRTVVDSKLHPAIEQLRFTKDCLDDEQDMPTLWDVLLQRRSDLLIGCRDRSHSVNASSYPRRPIARSLRYSGAQRFVYPHARTPSLNDSGFTSEEWIPLPVSTPGGSTAMQQRTGSPEPVVANRPVFHPLCKDGYYILSEAFYTNSPADMSLLEMMVWNYLKRETISLRNLHYVVSNHRAWQSTERYFFVPILLILIRSVMMDN